MAEIGRAGFHVKHTKDPGERGAILHEAMREIVPGAVDYWAARNTSIVVEDEHLDVAMVNDGEGGFRPCTDVKEVLTYGDGRLGRLHSPLKKDKKVADKKTGKETLRGGTITTSLLVSHLPKSMCTEIPGIYPILDEDGEPELDADGQPIMRSRWVARDRDEALQYFRDVVDFVSSEVLGGGQEAILGYDVQFSESTPHVQIIADDFEADPNHDGTLRPCASRTWFTHRDVRDSSGRIIPGKEKMAGYHERLKDYLIDRGYDIESDVDEERHLTGLAKDEYGEAMDARAKGYSLRSEAGLRARHADALERQVDQRKRELDERERSIEAEGRARGLGQGRAEGRAEFRRSLTVAIDWAREGQTVPSDPQSDIAAVQALLQHVIDDERGRVRAAARKRVDEFLEERMPVLIDEFLDRPDSHGRSYRPIFNHFVNQRFDAMLHGLGLTRSDVGNIDAVREMYVANGGEDTSTAIRQAQRQRKHGE